MQRRHNELTSQTCDLIDKTLQSLAIEFRCRVIKQQSRSHPGRLLQQTQLRDNHRHGDKLLLPPREHIPRRTPMEAHGDVGAMRASLCLPSRLISRP